MTKARTLLAAILIFLAGAGGARTGELPANTWTPVGDGKFEPPEDGHYPSLQGCNLVWLAESKRAVILPAFSKLGADYWEISFEKPEWTRRKGSHPENRLPDRTSSHQAYCYLPGLERILFLKEHWSYSKNKKPVSGWLANPADGKWEPIDVDLSMSDKSADFGPDKGRDGKRLPIWGSLVYDAHNKEAVAFGGGGTWGRVGKGKDKVKTGDWIYDEKSDPKRVRRLTTADKDVTEARRWFPAHCGTWTFSEDTKTWKPIEQPMGQQPSGRILPGMAYDASENAIVLFGGDDLARCMNDTWVYDCETRTWKEAKPPTAPQARAGQAMVYDPEQKIVLMAGGYTGGWKALSDTWAYDVAKNKWTKLALDLPEPATYASGAYLPEKKAVLMVCYPGGRRNKKAAVYALNLNMASAPSAKPVETDPKMAYHCKAKSRPTDLPGEWLIGEGAPEKEEAVLARLKSLPANTWKNMNPAKLAPERNWGSYIYDVKTHKGFAWGGGHSAYPGAEISTYDLLTNRWRGMAQPTNYNPVWLHGMVGGPPGISFGGWSLLPSHARKSYGVDPVSDSVVTYAGDVFSIKHRSVVSHVGPFPARFSVATQAAYVTMPDGLYAFASSTLAKVNVAAGKWEMIDNKGPKGHHEYDFLAADPKRGRILYFKSKGADVWAFDLEAKSWTQEQPAGGKPATVKGDATYIPEMDAVMTVFATQKKGQELIYFYKCAEKKWYTAPVTGDPFNGGNGGKDWSPGYYPELKIVVRITPTGFHKWVNVHVMRLEPDALKLTPVE